MRRYSWTAIGLAALLCGAGAFVTVRALTGGSPAAVQHSLQAGPAQAQAPQGNTTPFADAPGTDETASSAFANDLAQPRFSGTLAGIRFDGGGHRGPEFNCAARPVHVPFTAAAGTPLDIFASGLPAGLAPGNGAPGINRPSAVECGGELIATDRIVSVGSQLVTIGRVLRPEAWIGSNFPATRASVGTLAGRPAVLVKSIMPDGRGGAFVIWADPVPNGYVVTMVYGGNAPLSAIEPVASAVASQQGSAR